MPVPGRAPILLDWRMDSECGHHGVLCNLLGLSVTLWFTLLLVFIIVPAIFGVSFGIRRLYMKTLLRIFTWATLRIERGVKENSHALYRPLTNDPSRQRLLADIHSPATATSLTLLGHCHITSRPIKVNGTVGIIAKGSTSLEKGICEMRGSGHSNDGPEFELSDIFYFCRQGMESIMDDEVTKRFSAEELETWNLLSRTNYNFQHISLRLTVLWGLGMLVRYTFLMPLRIALAITGVSLLVFGTSVVGYLPNGWLVSFHVFIIAVWCMYGAQLCILE
ncbi:hypothetical protein AB205_0153940 [Aquarana catesbeiana]|uniref:Glycerol-3-phosphate acyltransferase 4 n=1 Tax=Aquarana catesbeiana TaxID=8400 RepID=A0A2G9RG22_AQUCT|nr:hypothetical protein AB205_0153940 [Aquarana catesbeiana]